MIDRYYYQALRYLQEEGEDFARRYPQEARYLNLQDIDDRDPHVERLFEGFALLTGWIHWRLDDEQSVFARNLLGLIQPRFLYSIPSLSILAFDVKDSEKTVLVPRGVEVCTKALEDHGGLRCRFRTCFEVPVRPIDLESVIVNEKVNHQEICFKFKAKGKGGISYENLDFSPESPLRIFLHNLDRVTTYALHLFLTRYVEGITIEAMGDRGTKSQEIKGQAGVKPVGFDLAKEGLFVSEESTKKAQLTTMPYFFYGYDLLLEYFNYPEKFFFVDLCGFNQFEYSGMVTELTVHVFFKDRLPSEIQSLKAENFPLHCTPIINLFSKDTGVRVDYRDSEYRIVADHRYQEKVEVYSVDRVTSNRTGRAYVPFYSLEYAMNVNRQGMVEGYYHTAQRLRFERQEEHTRKRELRGVDTYISIITPDAEVDSLTKEELSLEITCTNGIFPRELKVGEINQGTSKVPANVTFENINRPTPPIYPPLHEKQLEWALVSHLALNYYYAFTHVDTLRAILRLYDWKGENEERIMGIRRVTSEPEEMIDRGSVIRGIHLILEMEIGNFTVLGDLHLFGWVLSHFLSLYAPINSLVKLSLTNGEGETLFTWTPKIEL